MADSLRLRVYTPEQAFYMVGTIEDAIEKARKLAA